VRVNTDARSRFVAGNPVEDNLVAEDIPAVEDNLAVEDNFVAEDNLAVEDNLVAEDNFVAENSLVAEDILVAGPRTVQWARERTPWLVWGERNQPPPRPVDKQD
jgi:hypothetical protein